MVYYSKIFSTKNYSSGGSVV